MKTVILGIGNRLLTDEGIGLHVLDALEEPLKDYEGVSLIDGGTLSFTLATEIEGADNLIIIDAAQLKGRAGGVETFLNQQMDDFLGGCKRSVHDIGLLDLMDIARLTGTLPEERALIGIQPDHVQWGEKPTPAVADSIPVAVAEVEKLLNGWGLEVAA